MTVTEPYRECFLYVDGAYSPVLDLVTQHFGVSERFGGLVLPGFEIDVEKNDRILKGDDAADFVNWQTIVEVYAGEQTPDDQVVRFVTDLMTHFRSVGHRVVAACDFEDELPQDDFV
jgi:hypothetical protein